MSKRTVNANGTLATVTGDPPATHDATHHAGGSDELTPVELNAATRANAATIPNANTAHALAAAYSDVEVETALNALGGKVNDILAAVRTAGVVQP